MSVASRNAAQPNASLTDTPPWKPLAIIPTFNERASLPMTLTALRDCFPELDVLVVDDNSPDGTGEWVEEAATRDVHLHTLHRQGKGGLGKAYLAGFNWAIARGSYSHLVEMDADGSHLASDLGTLFAAARIRRADAVIGSRWVPGGGTRNWPWYRQLISRAGTGYAKAMLGLNVNDATAGFRVYRLEALKRLPFDEIESQGYCFQVDLTWRFVQAGLNVVEVPITFVERASGESKMSADIVREALWRITTWGIRHRLAQLRQLPQALRRRS